MNRSIDRRQDLPRLDRDVAAEVIVGRRRLRCVVENTSPNGAGLKIDPATLLPQQFQLVLGGKTVSVIVMWRRDERVGVCFAPGARLSPP